MKTIRNIVLMLLLLAGAGVRLYASERGEENRPWVIEPREATMVVDSTLYVCDYPYYVYYPDPRTGPQWHLYTYEGEVHSFYDWDDSLGIAVLGMRIQTKTLPAPVIDLPDVLTMCQDGSNVTIPLRILSGKPDTFLIDYSPDMAARIGRRWDAGRITPETSEIVLRDIPLMGVGHNFAYLSLGQVPNPLEKEACMTLMKYMDLNFELGGYLREKYGRMLFIDNNPEVAVSDGDISIPVSRKLTFSSFQWYKDGKKIEGATEQYYTEDGKLLQGEYYAEVTATDGITYKCCPIVLTGEEVKAEVQKCWRNGQLVLLINGKYYDLLGHELKIDK